MRMNSLWTLHLIGIIPGNPYIFLTYLSAKIVGCEEYTEGSEICITIFF